jgi:hypothetical protein
MTDITKIPDYILEDARRNVPMNSNHEEFTDEQMSRKSKKQIFNHYLEWNGIIGYGDHLLEVIEDLFNVKLKEDE